MLFLMVSENGIMFGGSISLDQVVTSLDGRIDPSDDVRIQAFGFQKR